ncbi:MAG: RluA family pseudouridine synthase [Sarcina sp.]
MSMLTKIVESEHDNTKIKPYLKDVMGLSSRFLKKAGKEDRVFVNGKPVFMNFMISAGDKIEVELQREESQDIEPEDIPVDVVYEDDDILVLNKKPFMVVHPTKNYNTGTLANGIINYFRNTNQNCIVRLVSRLDMNTSGLIIIAKNQFAHMRLSDEMKTERFEKRYLALVHGNLEEKEGTINKPIYRVGGQTIARVIDERGKESITHYRVVESFEGADLVECLLETGRTHQIRVHLQSLGHPIFGDELYGKEFYEADKEYIDRQALHAYGLDFYSPRSEEKLSLRATLPYDFNDAIEKLKNK